MLYKTWNRETSLYSHIVYKYIEYIYLFFFPLAVFFFFSKNQEFNIIQWNNCSGENVFQAPKWKKKILWKTLDYS